MRLLRLSFIVLSLLAIVANIPVAHGQATVGVQTFGAYDGFPDRVDVGSLGLHLEIPLYRKVGSGNGTAINISLTNYTPWPPIPVHNLGRHLLFDWVQVSEWIRNTPRPVQTRHVRRQKS